MKFVYNLGLSLLRFIGDLGIIPREVRQQLWSDAYSIKACNPYPYSFSWRMGSLLSNKRVTGNFSSITCLSTTRQLVAVMAYKEWLQSADTHVNVG